MRLPAVALLALILPAQDDPEIRRLIERLEDDSYEVRERAQKDLVQLGERALPALRKAVAEAAGSADRGELKARAQAAVRGIELAVKARGVYSEPRTITLDAADARLEEILNEIARQAGVRIDSSDVDREARATLAAKGAPLLRVLDDLCRGQAERSYEYADEGVIRFKRERHPGGPCAYGGPFRVRLSSLRQERSTDFAERKCVLHVTLEADFEKYLKPLKRYTIDLEEAWDDRGTALDVGRRGEGELDQVFGAGNRIFARAVVGGMGKPDASAGPLEFTLRGISPASSAVTIQGTLRYAFPLDAREVAFDALKPGESVECGDYRVRLESMGGGGRHFTLHFQRAGSVQGASPVAIDVERRLERQSLVGVDGDGEEHSGQWIQTGGVFQGIVIAGGGRVQLGGGSSDNATYQLMFPTLRTKTLKTIKFRFIDQTLVKEMPFRFQGIELP